MSSPPPSLPSRPELPEGVHRPEPPVSPEPGWGRGVALWAVLAVAFAAFIIASIAYAVIVAAAGLSASEAENAPGPLLGATFVQDAVLIGGAVLLAGGGVAAFVRLGIRRTRLGPAIGWALALLAAFWFVSAILIAIFGEPPEQEITQEIEEESAALAIAGYIAITCLLAPIAEEVFFRGLLFPVLRARWGVAVGVVVTGVLFSLVHASGSPVEALIVLFVLGAGLCLLYLRTGSLLPCIGLHALNNAIAFAVTKDMAWPVAVLTVVGSVVVSVSIALAFVRTHSDPVAA
jgi:membrane protease YdiL (CAAX protease family)